MVWLMILSVIILFILWMLLAPVELAIDTRVPSAGLQIRSIGKVSIVFEDEAFRLRTRIFFLRFEWKMEERSNRNEKKRLTAKGKKKINPERVFKGMWRMIKSFHVKEFELALSPDDYTLAGKLYPLNFFPAAILNKISVNFQGENYLLVRVATYSWRIANAWIRK